MIYPDVDLSHLRAISDCTGILQHGTHSVPNRNLGYTTDDNARALIVAAQHYEMYEERQDLDLAITYLSYLLHAQQPDKNFKNLMTFQRVFLDDDRTEDCYGRTMWACGYTASSAIPENIRVVAKRLFDESISLCPNLRSPRAWAYTIIGICNYLKVDPQNEGLLEYVNILAGKLLWCLNECETPDWVWYEMYMTYGNAILPMALFEAAYVTGSEEYLSAATRTTKFLTNVLIPDSYLDIIGNLGWYKKGQERAHYDQQAIDAGYTVYHYIRVYEITKNKEYLQLAHIANEWFFGNNIQKVWVYNPDTKGCYDGINATGVNLNQGAESTICFLLAQIAMNKYK